MCGGGGAGGEAEDAAARPWAPAKDVPGEFGVPWLFRFRRQTCGVWPTQVLGKALRVVVGALRVVPAPYSGTRDAYQVSEVCGNLYC